MANNAEGEAQYQTHEIVLLEMLLKTSFYGRLSVKRTLGQHYLR
jgi:hypothetical protein